jgi:hypothetical protein
MKIKNLSTLIVLLSLLFAVGSVSAAALEPMVSTFTYQGSLMDGGQPANGSYDFEFRLYDAPSAGVQVGSIFPQGDVTVQDGLFTVELDFADVFDGTALYLQVGVRPGDSVGAYTLLTPRQALTAAPFAQYASKAPWSGLTDVPAGFADGTDDGGVVYTAGSGLSLTGTQFSVTGAPWSGLTGVPAGFADGVDDGGVAYTAGSGLTLTDAQFSVTGAPWSGLSGVPAGFADGVDDGVALQNVKTVAKSGGDFTTISAALASITDASDSNRYLIHVAPGVYSESVTMKPFVDIEGSGELTTTITFTGSSSASSGTVLGADDAELRFLTVENTGGADYAVAIYNNSVSPRLTHLSANASGGMISNFGIRNISSSMVMESVKTSVSIDPASSRKIINYGVFNSSSSPTLTNSSISASDGERNYGVFNDSSSPAINNCIVRASGGYAYGLYNIGSGAAVRVNHSQISAETLTILTSLPVLIGASQLEGGSMIGSNGATVTCAGVYDENYTFYANTCP